jgi:RNA polymerase sigma-70 factor (ECF subfamily)
VEKSSHFSFTSIQQGDITAYEALFKNFYQPLCQYAYTFIQDRDDAEEIVQNTFLSIWEKRDGLNIQTSVKSYLYAMVRNAALNAIKHVKVKTAYAAMEMAVAESSVEAVSRVVVANELERRISLALEKLPTQCKAVFMLSRFEDKKYAEIAEELQISIKTVENHMGKALRIMREELQEYLPLFLLWMIKF